MDTGLTNKSARGAHQEVAASDHAHIIEGRESGTVDDGESTGEGTPVDSYTSPLCGDVDDWINHQLENGSGVCNHHCHIQTKQYQAEIETLPASWVPCP
jgi:hypothetical protein